MKMRTHLAPAVSLGWRERMLRLPISCCQRLLRTQWQGKRLRKRNWCFSVVIAFLACSRQDGHNIGDVFIRVEERVEGIIPGLGLLGRVAGHNRPGLPRSGGGGDGGAGTLAGFC